MAVINNTVYEIKKQVEVTNLMQLIDLNGTKKNFQSDFVVSVNEPNKNVNICVINQNQLDNGEFDFEQSENGKYSRRVIYKKNQHLNHYIALKKLTNDTDNVTCSLVVQLQELESEEDPRGDMRDPREVMRDMRDPREVMRDPRGDMRDPREVMRDPRGDMRDPRGDVRDPRGDMRDPRGDMIDPRGDMRDPRGDMIDLRGDMRDMRDMRDPREDMTGYEDDVPQTPNTSPIFKSVGYSLNSMNNDKKNELRDKLYKLSETENYKLTNTNLSENKSENKSGPNAYLILGVICFVLFGYFFYVKKIKK